MNNSADEKLDSANFKMIYQYRNGNFLPDSSQPDIENQYKITSHKYTPHKSTRYCNVEIGGNGKALRKNESGVKIECDKELPELYNMREDCCGCTACYAICPEQAIVMRPCEEGFLYPVVDAAKCIRCYQCIKVCPIKRAECMN